MSPSLRVVGSREVISVMSYNMEICAAGRESGLYDGVGRQATDRSAPHPTP